MLINFGKYNLPQKAGQGNTTYVINYNLSYNNDCEVFYTDPWYNFFFGCKTGYTAITKSSWTYHLYKNTNETIPTRNIFWLCIGF